MQLSDRISRLVLVCTGIGFFWYILKMTIQGISKSFSTIYSGTFPFGVEQVLLIVLFINAFIILIFGILYCFYELRTYGNYQEINISDKYIKKADKYYIILLKVSYISTYMTFSLMFILFFILPIIISFKVISYTILGISLGLLILVSIKKWKKNWFKELFLVIKKTKLLSIHLVILFFWISFTPALVLLGINQNLDTKFEITFIADDTPQIDFLFSDHAPDKMPNNIYIKIITSGEEKEIKITKKEFHKSFIKVNEYEQPNSLMAKYLEKNNMYAVEKSSFLFKTSVNLTQLIGKNNGYIEIKFQDKSFITNRGTYRIVNEFFTKNDKLYFNQDKFKVGL